MKIIIVNCFDTYEERIDMVANYYNSKGYEVKVVCSTFQHINKEYREKNKKDYYYIDALAYKKNLSLKRLISHYKFGKEAFKYVKKENPNLLYVAVPPNSLVKFASNYKKKNSDVKIIFDIIDLWPETMPKLNFIFNPIFNIWKNLRTKNIKSADFVITECNYYQKYLLDELVGVDTQTLYLSKLKSGLDKSKTLNFDEIIFCYLGSINNIIDINRITKLLAEINQFKPVKINIIGDGEKKDFFIQELKNKQIEVTYYGKIFQQETKQQIFNASHFGINIMKETVEVALTMKSLDYFEGALPIVNNIKGDTTEIINTHKIGFNMTDNNCKDAENILNLSPTSYYKMQYRVSKVFDDLFSTDKFVEKMDIINEEIKGK